MAIRRMCVLGLLSLCIVGATYAGKVDADRDGLPDDFEQALLRKFVPTFHINKADCDVAPAEFEKDSHEPKVKARNGTIYGQVFPVHRAHAAGAWIEVHYFHLWGNDCGQAGHALDVESVSVLLRADRNDWQPEAWQATYWYAAAHEKTLCDMSNAATAEALRSLTHGPDVWVSKDKHASFLNKKLCAHGCGKDECDGAAPLRVTKLINLGEPGAPINGSEWSASALWPLTSKMRPDFAESLLARIGDGYDADLVPARNVVRGMRTTIKVSGKTYSSLASANSNTGAAFASGAGAGAVGINVAATSVATSATQVDRSVKNTFSATGKSLRRAFRWVPSSR